jgi:UDP-N-acetylglucosamine 2-epimerase (non-hydrolysing)
MPSRKDVMAARVLTLFGTRPEVIKLAPVIAALEQRPGTFETINVTSAQHTELLYPFTDALGVRIDHDLAVMRPDQSPGEVCARVMTALEPIVRERRPDLILLQGDTTTTLAGALVGFYERVPVGHVEAGLRSGNPLSPFPEEMNRRLVSRCASFHFAATEHNRQTLLSEGVSDEIVFVTGNPVVDALQQILRNHRPSQTVNDLLRTTDGSRRIVLTTHRRESLGRVMRDNLAVLRRFVEDHGDVTLIFPVHPNPSVVEASRGVLAGHDRIHLTDPLGYGDFIHLLASSWLIVSDSGGVQEEAPTLGKPVLILRENTERPEAVDCGVARLVGGRPERLASMLDEIDRDRTWIARVAQIENPFGRGDSGPRIAAVVARVLGVSGSDLENKPVERGVDTHPAVRL